MSRFIVNEKNKQTMCCMQVVLLAITPRLDDWSNLQVWLEQSANPVASIGNIGASCAMAVLINWSTARVLAISTPVTYLILGHCKTCLNIILGYIVFGAQVEVRNVIGVAIAVMGLMAYGAARCYSSR